MNLKQLLNGWRLVGFLAVIVIMAVTTNLAARQLFLNQQIEDNLGSVKSEKVKEPSAKAIFTEDTLLIPAVKVQAPIEKVGVNAKNEVGAPSDLSRVGIFAGASKPGQGGTVFIDGHAGTEDIAAVFDDLHNLKVNDEIAINQPDGMIYKYEVQKVETLKLNDIDMEVLIKPDYSQPEKLILMTCSGDYNLNIGTYQNRVIITAKIKA